MDWLRFLRTRGIPHSTSGPNVGRDHVVVKCPFCRDDPGMHMSIHLGTKGWRCWRKHSHCGVSPVKLIAALLGCSFQQAATLAGVRQNFVPTGFLDRMKQCLNPQEASDPHPPLQMPKVFHPFDGSVSCRLFVNYLRSRGHTLEHAEQFGLRYCTLGRFRYRIIFPVHHQGVLVSWTGRTVNPDNAIRYLALEDEKSVRPITNYLLWFDYLMQCDADTIYIVEGPFDALRINVLGSELGVCATCFFTSEPSDQQIGLFGQLLPRFKNKRLLLDRGALSIAMQVRSDMYCLGVDVQEIPDGIKDPGELNNKQFRQLLAVS